MLYTQGVRYAHSQLVLSPSYTGKELTKPEDVHQYVRSWISKGRVVKSCSFGRVFFMYPMVYMEGVRRNPYGNHSDVLVLHCLQFSQFFTSQTSVYVKKIIRPKLEAFLELFSVQLCVFSETHKFSTQQNSMVDFVDWLISKQGEGVVFCFSPFFVCPLVSLYRPCIFQCTIYQALLIYFLFAYNLISLSPNQKITVTLHLKMNLSTHAIYILDFDPT